MHKLSDISFKAVISGALVDNLGTMFSLSLLIMALSSTGAVWRQTSEHIY